MPHAEFPLGPFTPYAENPILRPQGDGWESASVYNPAAVVKDGQVVLLYRAHADDIVSHVGLATSDDGIHFERRPEPVLSPSEDYERHGCEDPRVTEIDGTYYLTYTAYDGTNAQLCLATSTDLFTWEKHGPLFPDFNTFEPNAADVPTPWSKAGAILDRKVDGRWLMYFGEGSIYHAWSDDLIHWEPCPQDEPLMLPTAARDVRRVPGRGRPAADHHRQRADPAVAQCCGEVRRRHRALHLRPAALRPRPADRDHGADELPVARADHLRGPARAGLQRDLRRGPGALQGTWFAYYGQSDSTLGVATYKVGETYRMTWLEPEPDLARGGG